MIVVLGFLSFYKNGRTPVKEKIMKTAQKRRYQLAALGILFWMALHQSYGVPPENSSPSKKNYLRGLYLSNKRATSLAYVRSIIAEGAPLGINMAVLDVHPYGRHLYRVDKDAIALLNSSGFYCAARIVCFQDGLDRLPVPKQEIERLRLLVENAASSGFQEIQLDYIRFKDGGYPYPLNKKYAFIAELLQDFRKIAKERGLKISADVFGRVAFNRNDYVGQKLEIFADYMDVIYPMLYPSHFTGDYLRMSKPGDTVREGIEKGIMRLKDKPGVAIHAYIQAFPYYIGRAGTDLPGYIALQIEAVESTPARGWVAWNAGGNYSAVFEALRRLDAAKSQGGNKGFEIVTSAENLQAVSAWFRE